VSAITVLKQDVRMKASTGLSNPFEVYRVSSLIEHSIFYCAVLRHRCKKNVDPKNEKRWKRVCMKEIKNL